MPRHPAQRLAPLLALCTFLLAAWAPANGPGVFALRSDRTAQGVVWIGPNPPTQPLGDSPMLERLAGRSGSLSPQELRRLDATVGRPVEEPLPESAQVIARVRIGSALNGKTLEILRGPEDRAWVRELGDGGRVITLDWARARKVLPPVASPLTPTTLAAERVVELTHPLRPSPIWLDADEYAARFATGARSTAKGAARTLADEQFFIRLPRGYRPETSWGVLCWVDPTPTGRPPAFLHEAADELGLILVGNAASGNTREAADRMQVVFDGLETVRARFHVEHRRVYVTGISGGGRVSSMLWACFPDVFTGAVPIVGLNVYKNVPAGDGKHWRASFRKPDRARFNRLRAHRCACITGPTDFNYEQIVKGAAILEKDGLSVRVDDYADMGHTAPTSERFLDAMRWVDEPGRSGRTDEVRRGDALWDAYVAEYPEALPPPNDAARGRLVAITREAPFTPAAWRAVSLLRSEPQLGLP